MSFIRKFVSKLQVRKRSNDSVGDDDHAKLTPEEETFSDASASATLHQGSQPIENVSWQNALTTRQEDSSSFVSLKEDLSDENLPRSASLTSLDRKARKHRKKLNRKLEKYRRERWRVDHKAAEIQHLQNEISTLMKMLTQLKKQKNLLEVEKNNKLRELVLTCKLVSEDVGPELRKKEPLQFKKYHSAKTVADTHTLLQNIHLKQKALQHLEVMTYKKMLNLEHKNFAAETKNNNNNMLDDGAIEILMEGAMVHLEQQDRDRYQQEFDSPKFPLRTIPLFHSMTPVPLAFDNPVFTSSV